MDVSILRCFLGTLCLIATAANSSFVAPCHAEEASADPASEQEAFFTKDVLPILREHCFECHAGKQNKGGLKIDTRHALIAGGDSGAVINEDQPEASMLLEAVRYESYEMPPKGKLAAEN